MTTTTHALVSVGVQATLAAYAHALDGGRTEELVALFSPDGTVEIAGMGTFKGHEAIHEAYAGLVPAQPQMHMVANTLVTSWTEDEATAVSDFVFLYRRESGWVMPVTGRYDDTFRKADDGSWLIHSKTATYVS